MSATARAALKARAAAAAADAANDKQPRRQAPQGALENAFQKPTAGKADDAWTALFFAEFSIAPRITEYQYWKDFIRGVGRAL